MIPAPQSFARLVLCLYATSLFAQGLGMPLPIFDVPTAHAEACGDFVCDVGESSASCPSDCYCGNVSCDADESTLTCVADCGSSCGDTVCNGTESTFDCPTDCGTSCGDAACNGAESTATCPSDCGSFCGDAVCNGSEGTTNCYADCGSFCGDMATTGSEECDSGGIDSGYCDSDCTAVTCGDWHANIMASETCDNGGTESGTCDDDCTSPSCGDFDPNRPATRSQVMSLIGEAFCQTNVDTVPALTLTDVNPEDSTAGIAQKLVIRGDNNSFQNARPDAPISRAELAAMILRAVRGLRQ